MTRVHTPFTRSTGAGLPRTIQSGPVARASAPAPPQMHPRRGGHRRGEDPHSPRRERYRSVVKRRGKPEAFGAVARAVPVTTWPAAQRPHAALPRPHADYKRPPLQASQGPRQRPRPGSTGFHRRAHLSRLTNTTNTRLPPTDRGRGHWWHAPRVNDTQAPTSRQVELCNQGASTLIATAPP